MLISIEKFDCALEFMKYLRSDVPNFSFRTYQGHIQISNWRFLQLFHGCKFLMVGLKFVMTNRTFFTKHFFLNYLTVFWCKCLIQEFLKVGRLDFTATPKMLKINVLLIHLHIIVIFKTLVKSHRTFVFSHCELLYPYAKEINGFLQALTLYINYLYTYLSLRQVKLLYLKSTSKEAHLFRQYSNHIVGQRGSNK